MSKMCPERKSVSKNCYLVRKGDSRKEVPCGFELLAPIYKGEKRSIHSCGFFVTEESFPALDGGVDRLSTEAVHLWSDLVCPLPTQASYSSLPVLPPRRGGDATGVDLMAFQTNLVSYHQNL